MRLNILEMYTFSYLGLLYSNNIVTATETFLIIKLKDFLNFVRKRTLNVLEMPDTKVQSNIQMAKPKVSENEIGI